MGERTNLLGWLTLAWGAAAILSAAPAAAPPLRVCANSGNFPFSDTNRNGFENKLAELAAAKLGTTVAYTWWPARENFLDRTLKKGLCDVVMGVPAHLDDVDTTRPYYRSSYVFVSRADMHLGLTSLRDDRLKHLKIGVYLIGDDQTPPAIALSQEGINNNVRGFMTFFDRSTGSSRLIRAVDDRSLDVAAVWGPLIGYYVRNDSTPLDMTPIRDTGGFAPLVFQYDIAIGVRRGNEALRKRLDRFVATDGDQIRQLLAKYGVPVVSRQGD